MGVHILPWQLPHGALAEMRSSSDCPSRSWCSPDACPRAGARVRRLPPLQACCYGCLWSPSPMAARRRSSRARMATTACLRTASASSHSPRPLDRIQPARASPTRTVNEGIHCFDCKTSRVLSARSRDLSTRTRVNL